MRNEITVETKVIYNAIGKPSYYIVIGGLEAKPEELVVINTNEAQIKKVEWLMKEKEVPRETESVKPTETEKGNDEDRARESLEMEPKDSRLVDKVRETEEKLAKKLK